MVAFLNEGPSFCMAGAERTDLDLAALGPLRRGKRRQGKEIPNGQAAHIETGKWEQRLEDARSVERLARRWGSSADTSRTEKLLHESPAQPVRPAASASIGYLISAQAESRI